LEKKVCKKTGQKTHSKMGIVAEKKTKTAFGSVSQQMTGGDESTSTNGSSSGSRTLTVFQTFWYSC